MLHLHATKICIKQLGPSLTSGSYLDVLNAATSWPQQPPYCFRLTMHYCKTVWSPKHSRKHLTFVVVRTQPATPWMAGGSFCTRHRVFWETRLFFHFRFPCVARSHVSCSLENCAMVYTIKNYYMNDFGFVSKFVFILCSTFVLLLSLVIVCVRKKRMCVCVCQFNSACLHACIFVWEREMGREKHPIGLSLSLSFSTLPQLYINIWLKSHKLIAMPFIPLYKNPVLLTLYYYF